MSQASARRFSPTAALAAAALAFSLGTGALAATTDGAVSHTSATDRPSAATAAWIRKAARRFVTAELSRDAAEACAVLDAPLRATIRGRTCEQRWAAHLARLARVSGERAALRAQLGEVAHAPLTVHGNTATLALSAPLYDGTSRLVWTEMCWMVSG